MAVQWLQNSFPCNSTSVCINNMSPRSWGSAAKPLHYPADVRTLQAFVIWSLYQSQGRSKEKSENRHNTHYSDGSPVSTRGRGSRHAIRAQCDSLLAKGGDKGNKSVNVFISPMFHVLYLECDRQDNWKLLSSKLSSGISYIKTSNTLLNTQFHNTLWHGHNHVIICHNRGPNMQ